MFIINNIIIVRARQFPAIISCTTIDWFHEWPPEALFSVSERFLTEIPELPRVKRCERMLERGKSKSSYNRVCRNDYSVLKL
ncbi:Dynein heavy chain 1, axonemal [Armadillidium nasatum]|uniref:Dynein heavy chain 1, axonemal n=1 Tax=Armadillidium nasatum TaxID=96803 RepID=A0A5N5SKV1_9CRUS|nr:Dynein heavy chain 1, axonemal [Armadillidium nasatum]